MKNGDNCPSYEAVEAHLRAPTKKIADHLHGCASCKGMYEQLRAEESLLKDLRGSLSGAGASVDRTRIRKICDAAFQEAGMREERSN